MAELDVTSSFVLSSSNRSSSRRLLCFLDKEEPTLARCRRRSMRAPESLGVGIRSLVKIPEGYIQQA